MVSAILLQVMFNFLNGRIIRREVSDDNFRGFAESKTCPLMLCKMPI